MGIYTKSPQRQAQEKRQAGFPANKLAFLKGWGAAGLDRSAMKEWAEGRATFDWLRAQVAKNNLLDKYFPNGMVPAEMMRQACKDTGWRRIRL